MDFSPWLDSENAFDRHGLKPEANLVHPCRGEEDVVWPLGRFVRPSDLLRPGPAASSGSACSSVVFSHSSSRRDGRE